METTPTSNVEYEFQKKIKTFSAFSDKKQKYNILIQSELNSKILITAFDDKNQKKYYESYSLNILKNNKYLSLFETIDEIYDELKDKIEKKEPKIFEEDNTIKLAIETFHTKYKEINFYLKEKDKAINEMYKQLYFIIDELKEKEKKQDEKIKSLEEIVQELKNNNNELFEKNKLLENKIESLKEIINYNNNNYYYDSEQLSNQENMKTPNVDQITSSEPYIPKSRRENKNNDININLNLDTKPYIPKNFKENK